MNPDIDRLFAQIHTIEDDIERRLTQYRAQFHYRVEKGRAVFAEGIQASQRRIRTHALRYLASAPLRHIAVAPVIYAMVVPFALLDLSLTIYQFICFSAWGIARVRRRNYVVIDRHRLAYLNIIEKTNCVFCGYANGILAYAREIAGRTEQFWCPIRHATQIRLPHAQYKSFVDYGDAEGYRTKLASLRDKLR